MKLVKETRFDFPFLEASGVHITEQQKQRCRRLATITWGSPSTDEKYTWTRTFGIEFYNKKCQNSDSNL